jgi:hypothetical protein
MNLKGPIGPYESIGFPLGAPLGPSGGPIKNLRGPSEPLGGPTGALKGPNHEPLGVYWGLQGFIRALMEPHQGALAQCLGATIRALRRPHHGLKGPMRPLGHPWKCPDGASKGS